MSLRVFQTAPWTAGLPNFAASNPPHPPPPNHPFTAHNFLSLLSHCPPPPSAHSPAAASPPQQQSGLCLAMLHSSFCSSPAQQLLLLLRLLLHLVTVCRPCTAAVAVAVCSLEFSSNCSHTQAFFSCPFGHVETCWGGPGSLESVQPPKGIYVLAHSAKCMLATCGSGEPDCATDWLIGHRQFPGSVYTIFTELNRHRTV
eukprot:1144009-Pelagomonas_calceolata.AAC.2